MTLTKTREQTDETNDPLFSVAEIIINLTVTAAAYIHRCLGQGAARNQATSKRRV